VKPIHWRNAIRDSELDSTAKLVAHTLSTYMDSHCEAWPAKETLAAGAGKSKRTTDVAIEQIADAGYIEI
jgi:helix-turn-helix protein